MRIKNLIPQILRENLILFILLPAITAACIALWYFGNLHIFDRMDRREVGSEDGIYDLSGIDFENTVVRISGNAEYIPNALLTPEEFDARAEDIETGRPSGYGNVATSRIRLIFPDNDTYMLVWDSSDYTETLYINGQLRGQAGKPGLTKESEEAGNDFWYFSVKPEGGVVEIVRQVSNFAHREGGGTAGISAGSEENIRLQVSLLTDIEGAVAGVFLTLFFVHLTLYFIVRSYRANLYFAVLCLTWALRTGVTGTKIFLGIIPFLSWEAAFRIEYLSIPVAAVFVILFIKEVFPSVTQKWLVRAVVGVSSAFGLLYLFAETLYMSHALLYYYVFYIAAIVWLVVRFAIKIPAEFKRGEYREEHFASLFGLAVFFYAAVHDALYHNDIYLFGLNTSLTEVAMLIFSFSQMIAMSRGTMREFALAREAERKLAKEKERLEKELREAAGKLPGTVTCGLLSLDTVADKAFLCGDDMRLSQKEFAILLYLVQNEGKLFTSEDIYEKIWQQPMAGDTTSVKSAVYRLRKKLESDSSGLYITMTRGKGYRFISSAKTASAE